MPQLTLEGDTLGERHKHLNSEVLNAIKNNQNVLPKISSNDTDIKNLIKIDVASKSKNVEYIIEVLKCTDMLYISRAIKKSTWLITEQKYMDIINPDYLHKELFPYMLTKAINKLLLQIRLHLIDENRIKSFYTYIKRYRNNDEANKWLVNCSIPFIESIIQNEKNISVQVFKRLCKRSIKFLKYHDKVEELHSLLHVLFLLKSNTEEFLDILDEHIKRYVFPRFSQKYTEIIMKKCSSRVIDNFENYIRVMNLSAVAKHLKKEDIKAFLLKYMKNNITKTHFQNYANLEPFITNIPKEDRFQFVKEIYIDKNRTVLASEENENTKCDATMSNIIPTCDVNVYRWYEHAPFEIAFVEIKKLIRAERSSSERHAMLVILINCAKNNPQNINILLQYYYDKHRNEPFMYKIQFVNKVIEQMATHEFDSENWNILDTLFHTLEVYIESNNKVQFCLRAIVLYKVLHDEVVPDIVEKKLKFYTFKEIQDKLNEEQQTKVFTYLLTLIASKIKNKTIKNELDFENAISLIENALHLIKDWKKSSQSYEFIKTKLEELVLIKKQNSWKVNFSSLYNVNKSFRRQLFEESAILYPVEEVYLNVLKHKPELLTSYTDMMDTQSVDDFVSMPRLLAKLRIYWPHSLAQEWSDKYIKQIVRSNGHKAIIESLFVLLPQNQIMEIAKKYAPTDSKINWSDSDKIELSVQKNIAKYLHKVRPITDLDLVLLYANGDYLQFSLPSINALSHNISKNQSIDFISKLINSTASLQKYGLRLAFIKLKYDEIIPIFSKIWKSTLNVSIKTQIFTHTYNLLCTEKDPLIVVELCKLLEGFIENMETDENQIIFNMLGDPHKVPECVQKQFYIKSYQYLTSLPPAANSELYINRLLTYSPRIIDQLEDDFVVNKLLSPVTEIMSSLKLDHHLIHIVCSYVLFGRTEEEQCERFRKVLGPALEYAFLSWDTVNNYKYVSKDKINLLLHTLCQYFIKMLCFRQIVVPVKLFTEIKTLMQRKIPLTENYTKYTCWALTCEYVKLVAEHSDMFRDSNIDKLDIQCWLPSSAIHIWEAVQIKAAPMMALKIVTLLKEDTVKYSFNMCYLFSSALNTFFTNLKFERPFIIMEILKYMLVNDATQFIPSYIVVFKSLPTYGDNEELKKRDEIRAILSANPSLETHMLYHKHFDKIV